ncbi:hypothetical protein TNCV_4306681 [Trichonephila clavipes]|nr:hypothetical protein TNCV_4306681 [Trichonephila clavipes]
MCLWYTIKGTVAVECLAVKGCLAEKQHRLIRVNTVFALFYVCGSQSQAVFARRRSKSKLKLLDIRAELERRENARGARAGVTF